MNLQQQVAIVVNPASGVAMEAIPERFHLWVCHSPINTPFVRALQQSASEGDGPRQIAGFQSNSSESPEDMVSRILSTVDEHHGEWSSDPPWSTIKVYGARLVPWLKGRFQEYGAEQFEDGVGWFVCHREVPLKST